MAKLTRLAYSKVLNSDLKPERQRVFCRAASFQQQDNGLVVGSIGGFQPADVQTLARRTFCTVPLLSSRCAHRSGEGEDAKFGSLSTWTEQWAVARLRFDKSPTT